MCRPGVHKTASARLRLTWVIDAHATSSVEDSCGPDDHSRWPNEPALSEYRAKDHHCDNCCRVVLGLIWRVNDAAIDVAKDNAPA